MPLPEQEAAKRSAVKLGRQPALNFYDLAVAIRKLHESDPSLLSDLPEKTGMSRRRVYYLLDAGNLIEARQLSQSEAEAIGWSKLRVVTRYMLARGGTDDDEFFAFLELAKSTTFRDLEQSLRGRKPRSTLSETFTLTARNRSLLRKALVAFGAKPTPSGLAGKNEALVRLVKAAKLPEPLP